MGINLNGSIGSLYLGSTKIVEAYLGSVKVFGSEPLIFVDPKTIRFQFSNTSFTPTTGSSTATSVNGTWTAVNRSEGIWDWSYNNAVWGNSSFKRFRLNSDYLNGTVKILAGNFSGVTSVEGLFYNNTYIPAITEINHLYNTDSITNFRSAFRFCTSLTKFNTVLDVSSATDLNALFMQDRSLTTVKNITNSSNVTNATNVFRDCPVLKHIPIFDISNTADYRYFAYQCYDADNGKSVFDNMKTSKGRFDENTCLYIGRDSANNQLSLIPTALGGELQPVQVYSESSIIMGNASYNTTIQPCDIVNMTIQCTGQTVGAYFDNNTTTDKINSFQTGSSSATSSVTIKVNNFLGYPSTHTNNVTLRFVGPSGYNSNITASIQRFNYT